ncbi:MAG: trypsin-like peptidase domain-containing protein [Gemmatimonadaceae bacterium]
MLQSLSDDLTRAVEATAPSVVAIHARRRIPSSGILWRPGVVVAAHHTIQRDERITVTLHDGTVVGASLAGRDATTDIAILRLEQETGTPATVSADTDAKVGQLVLALGMPGPAVTAALGVVSATGGEWRTWHGGRIDRFIRLDVAIHDGFSGGPAIDASGRVIGLNTSGLARASAMTIPWSTVERVGEQLLSAGRVRRGFIGLGLQPVRLQSDVVKRESLPRDVGLIVVSIEEGGPAHRAGLSLGDVVVAFDGAPVSDPTELLGALAGDRIGSTAGIRLLRGGTPVELNITVGERPRSGEK